MPGRRQRPPTFASADVWAVVVATFLRTFDLGTAFLHADETDQHDRPCGRIGLDVRPPRITGTERLSY